MQNYKDTAPTSTGYSPILPTQERTLYEYTGKDTAPLSSTGHYPPMQHYKDTAPTSTGYSPILPSVNDFMLMQHTSAMQNITAPTSPFTAPISVTNKGLISGIQDLMQNTASHTLFGL